MCVCEKSLLPRSVWFYNSGVKSFVCHINKFFSKRVLRNLLQAGIRKWTNISRISKSK